MLLALLLPMSFPTNQTRSSIPTRARPQRRRLPTRIETRDEITALEGKRRWLLTLWVVLGTLAVLCIAPLRGELATGWTLPFWLIAAPLINLAAIRWSHRRERGRQR
ncbi:MAG: hypothetical protein ABIR16_07860 [Dokdonella sp.]